MSVQLCSHGELLWMMIPPGEVGSFDTGSYYCTIRRRWRRRKRRAQAGGGNQVTPFPPSPPPSLVLTQRTHTATYVRIGRWGGSCLEAGRKCQLCNKCVCWYERKEGKKAPVGMEVLDALIAAKMIWFWCQYEYLFRTGNLKSACRSLPQFLGGTS